ncbi:MAG TPA: CsbD family protein [Terriglobia bacterium]|nr:CsbD family protein [Terriglobia bacterium]
MNWDQIEGKWGRYKGLARQRWGKLTDNDLQVIAGKKDMLLGKLQELYGVAKEKAQRQIEAWSRSLSRK